MHSGIELSHKRWTHIMLKAHEWKEVELHTHALDPIKVSRICWSLVKVSNVDILLNDTLFDKLREDLFIVMLLEKCPNLESAT